MVPMALVWDCANYKMKQIVNLIKQWADSGQSESAVVLQGLYMAVETFRGTVVQN